MYQTDRSVHKLSLYYCSYENRYKQTNAISDLYHECKKQEVTFAVYCKHEAITTWRRVSDFGYQSTVTMPPSILYHYEIFPRNTITDYKIFTIITKHSVSLPNTMEDKLAIKSYPRVLWMCDSVQVLGSGVSSDRLSSRNACYPSVQNPPTWEGKG